MSGLEHSTKVITGGFVNWLNEEVRSSSNPENINSYLDDYETAIEGLRGGYDHPTNYTAIKLRSHLDRFPLWYEAFSYDPSDDYQSARLLFAPLMQTSGSYRNQCYLQAINAEDYLHRRLSRPVGINLKNTVSDRLRELLPSGNFSDARLSLENLGEQIERVSKIGEAAVKRACSRIKISYDLGLPVGSTSFQEITTAQYIWSRLAIDCVVFAAKIRKGELAAVPFLEAKSISLDPQVIYPLADKLS